MPFNDSLIEVELEKPGCCIPFRGKRLNDSTSNYEVILPLLESWIEQRGKLPGVGTDSSDIAAFRGIASQTSMGQVVRLRCAAMFSADNVINLMRRIRIVFVEQAILTPV